MNPAYVVALINGTRHVLELDEGDRGFYAAFATTADLADAKKIAASLNAKRSAA